MTSQNPASPILDHAQARPPKFGGLAIASLVLGIIAIVFSIIPIVNIVGVIVGIVGIALGAVGLFGSRKVMASFGVVLAVLAIILAFVINNAFVGEVDRQLSNRTVSNGTVREGSAAVTTAAPVAAPPSPPTFGQTYTWPSGLAIEVTKPTDCTPSPSAHPQTVQRGVKFGIVITNNSNKTFESALLTMGMQAQHASKTAERIIDLTGGCKVENFASATILPGKNWAYQVAVAVGEEPAETQLTFQPSLLEDKAVFVGNA